jgi:RimJ/RimL family protein N-acetyltransferase
MLVFTTERLSIRTATRGDIPFLLQLWNDGRVMRFVGFPQGLQATSEQLAKQLEREPEGVFDRVLIVTLGSGMAIGQCKLGSPDSDGIAETDVKLHPDHWRQGYGTEVKRGLLGYLFANTDCIAVQATPNRENAASLRMQEAVGGKIVGEGLDKAPPGSEGYRCDVAYLIYRVDRTDWD